MGRKPRQRGNALMGFKAGGSGLCPACGEGGGLGRAPLPAEAEGGPGWGEHRFTMLQGRREGGRPGHSGKRKTGGMGGGGGEEFGDGVGRRRSSAAAHPASASSSRFEPVGALKGDSSS